MVVGVLAFLGIFASAAIVVGFTIYGGWWSFLIWGLIFFFWKECLHLPGPIWAWHFYRMMKSPPRPPSCSDVVARDRTINSLKVTEGLGCRHDRHLVYDRPGAVPRLSDCPLCKHPPTEIRSSLEDPPKGLFT